MKEKDTTLTPLSFISRFGEFCFDPCAYPGHSTAKNLIIYPEKCGLKEQWRGRVWLNPPYSNPLPFLEKMFSHNNGIALVLNSTDTKWFHACLSNASGIFLLKGRPKFIKKDGQSVTLMRGCVLFSFGQQNDDALDQSGLEGAFIKLK